MTTFQIKIIAVVTMIIDHVGLFFFPQFELFRIIGRIAFPLFAWLIANGAYHTKDIKKYLYNIFFLSVLSQIPFTLANQQIGSPIFYSNVLFTLFLGLLAIYIIKNTSHKVLYPVIILGCAEVANLIHSDYGAVGVLSVVAFYLFLNSKVKIFISQISLLFIFPLLIIMLEINTGIRFSHLYMVSTTEVYGLVALLFIAFYKGKEGSKMKYLFYSFYPLQYICIYILKLLI